jgi:hypothetical protein
MQSPKKDMSDSDRAALDEILLERKVNDTINQRRRRWLGIARTWTAWIIAIAAGSVTVFDKVHAWLSGGKQ